MYATITEEDYDDITNYIRQERPRSLTKEERLDILRLHAEFRRNNARNVSATIARLLGRSSKTIKEVWSDYLRTKKIVVAPPPSNHQTRPTRIPRTHVVSSMVRQFIRQRSMTRVRTVAKDVMAVLVDAGIIQCDVNERDSVANGLRIVQQYLDKLGFKRGKRRGQATYSVSSAHAAARDIYIQRMSKLSPQTPVVYLDESYIHHHYARHQDSLFDPTDNAPLKEKHKGRRMCFIAGILASEADTAGAESKVLGLDIFEGGKKPRDEPKDYHGMFNHTYFVDWFAKAMDSVEALGKTGVIFVMDNAKYHKGLPADTPRGTWRKADLLLACQRYGVDVESHDLKKTIWTRLKPVLAARVDPVVVSMARSRGHDVVFTPPHHSDLQPIEMVWAKVKGDVGVLYTADTTFADVRSRLDVAFVQLPPAVIWNCVHHCEKLVKNLYELLLANDGEDAGLVTSDSSSSTSDSDLDS
ncbi:hypothetical protein AaE_015209 [Aphanomyces astaci]|nr:hypothetical protein AaE_015209 [Aphanomyces astaci]